MAEIIAGSERKPQKVAFIDDQVLLTSGVAALLASASISIEEFTSIERPEEFNTFDAVLLDLHLGSGERLQGCAAVHALVGAGCRVIVISGGSQRVDICDSIGLGARSYVPKDRPEHLVEVIDRVASGQLVLTGALAGSLRTDLTRRPLKSDTELHELTPQEVEFLEEAFHLDGDRSAALAHQWNSSELQDMLNRIWSTCSLRTASYALKLTPKEIEIVILSCQLKSRDDVIKRLNIENSTYQVHLTKIKTKYITAYPSASNLSPQEVIHVLGRRAL